MLKIKSLAKKLAVISAVSLAMQISLVTSVFADDITPPITPQGTSGDLSLQIFPAAKERAFAILVCNNGTDDVIGFTLDIDVTNYSPSEFFALPSGFAMSNPTDNGTYDINSGEWNGQILGYVPDDINTPDDNEYVPGECVAIGTIGGVTGEVGETITISASILSSTLGDSTPNVDPTPGNDSATYVTDPIIADPQLVLNTRLVTTGEIEAGDPVQYELTVSNIGDGDYVHNPGSPLGVYFIIPEGTSFLNIEDQDDEDNLGLTNCGTVAPGDSDIPAFSGLNTSIVGCQIDFLSGNFPAGYSFKLLFNMTASGPFADGDTKVLAVISGDDTDSLLIQGYMFTPGNDPYGFESDNTQVLTYDSSALIATVNRCSGVGEVVTTNTACFTISFNKEIYAPSFDIEDLLVTNAQVQSITQVSDNLWEIQLVNLTPNATVTISIDPDNDILDNSAVIADTQVLGINTVRYEVAGAATGATGTLPETGANADLSIFATLLMLAGLSMILASRKRTMRNA